MRLLTVALASLILLSGCISTSAVPLAGAGKHAPIPREFVAIFASEGDIPGPYEKVAIIHARGSSQWTNENMMFGELQREAAKMGANGIVVGGVVEPSAGAKVAGAVFGVSPQRKGEVLAVRYRPDPVYEVEEKVEMDTTFIYVPENIIGEPDYERGLLQVRPRVVLTDGGAAYALLIGWGGFETLDIADAPVRFSVDGERMELETVDPRLETKCDMQAAKCAFIEQVRAPLTLDQLRHLAGASRLAIQLGAEGFQQPFTSANIKVLVRFVEEHGGH